LRLLLKVSRFVVKLQCATRSKSSPKELRSALSNEIVDARI
jgi:hypothetical protein